MILFLPRHIPFSFANTFLAYKHENFACIIRLVRTTIEKILKMTAVSAYGYHWESLNARLMSDIMDKAQVIYDTAVK